MALPPGFELETAAPAGVKLPPGFQLETPSSEIPGPRQEAGFLTRLGRGAASLADVTLGGIIPGVVQQVGYSLVRPGRTSEEAQAATKRVVSALDQPFGKAFGVTNTPEYQQEVSRQILDFVGQNFQKGAKWLSEKTGLPAPDIENMLGTLTFAAPKIIPPVVGAVKNVTAPAIEKATIGAKLPFEKQAQAKREQLSLEDYARGPQLDAIADAQRLNIALNPVDVQPTFGPKATTLFAGQKGADALTAVNKNQVRNVALKEMGLPPTTQLNSSKPFQQARAEVAKPYEEVRRLPIQQADDAMVQRLEGIRTDLNIIGAKEYAPEIGKIVDDAISKTQTGLTGADLLKNISVLRERAKRTYDNKSSTNKELDIADTNLKIASELESMIDSSIFNPKLLQQYRDARQQMARIYGYEAATDLNTGVVDVNKLARITSSNSSLTGDIAALGRIAGNFPEVFTTKVSKPFAKAASTIGRTGAAGTLGGLAGYALGQDYASAALGSVLGAGAGRLGESFMARRMASPEYQAGLQMRDMRIPVNQLAVSMQPIPQNRAVVPYETPSEVLGPGEGAYFPNFVMQPERTAPSAQPKPTYPRLTQFGEYETTANALRNQEARTAELSRAAGRQAEQQQAAAAAAERKPTRGAIDLEINPLTGELEVVKPSVVPTTLQPTSIKSASEKIAAGRRFDLTAAEKVAFDKARIDLAEVAPGMKSLDDKAIAAKMQDRAWVQETVSNARAKTQELARQESLITEQLANRANLRMMAREIEAKNKELAKIQSDRQSMVDLLETLESQLAKGRQTKMPIGPGPKTREFRRNMLRPAKEDIQNNLAP